MVWSTICWLKPVLGFLDQPVNHLHNQTQKCGGPKAIPFPNTDVQKYEVHRTYPENTDRLNRLYHPPEKLIFLQM
jgi:hypothetical protein